MEHVIAAIIGVCLAASCGFRVFVPLLVAGVAVKSGYIEPAEGFAWLGSWPALVALSLATIAEIGAYYVPWLDNALDSIASPAAVVAGTLLMAASVTELDPLQQWSLAIIAGGGAAATVQGGTVAARAASTGTTGGLANSLVATVENFAGVVFSVLSIVLPIAALLLLIAAVVAMYYVGRKIIRRLWRPRTPLQA
jgi:hypothetical protein